MAEINLTNLDAALKRNYPISEITSQLYNMTPFYAQLKKKTVPVRQTGSGLNAYVPIQTRYNTSPMAIGEGSALPSARAPQFLQLVIPVAYHYADVEFTGQALLAAEKNSFIDETEIKMQGVKDSLARSIDRQITNGNTSGMLCMTDGTGGGSSSTVTVDNPGTHFLEAGMPIYSLSAETGGSAVADSDISEGLTESTAYTVYSIDSETTFTLGNAAGTAAVSSEKWADNRYIFRYGSNSLESMGLKGIVDNDAIKSTSSWFGLGTALTTIFGLSRSTYPILDATIVHNSNTNQAISEKNILKLLNQIEKNTGQTNAKPKRIFVSSYELRDRYYDIVSPDRRFVNNTVNLTGGYEAMYFQYGNTKIPWLVTKMAIPNTLFALDLSHLNIYQAGSPQWMEQTSGSMFDIKTDSSGRYHIYIATLFYFCSLGCKNFKAQGALRDISET